MRDEEMQAEIEDFIEGFNLDALDRVILFENGRTPITRAIRVHAALCGARTATFCYALPEKVHHPAHGSLEWTGGAREGHWGPCRLYSGPAERRKPTSYKPQSTLDQTA